MAGKRAASEDNVYTVEELAEHNDTSNDFWIAKQAAPFRGDFKVYDLTNFKHPGGPVITNYAGRNASLAFAIKHRDSRLDRAATVKTMGIIDRASITKDFLRGGGKMPQDEESQGNDEGGDGGETASEAPRKETANNSVKRKRPVEDEEDEAPQEKKPRKGATAKPAAEKPAAMEPIARKLSAKKPVAPAPVGPRTKNPRQVEPVPDPKVFKRPSARGKKEVAPTPKPKITPPSTKVAKPMSQARAKPVQPASDRVLRKRPTANKEKEVTPTPKTEIAAPSTKVAKSKPPARAKPGKPSRKGDRKKKIAESVDEAPQASVCGYWMKRSNKACTRVFLPINPTNFHCWQHRRFEDGSGADIDWGSGEDGGWLFGRT